MAREHDFQLLQDRITAWKREVLGDPSLDGSLRHLEEEVRDLVSDPYDPYALADVLILFMGICQKVGFSMEDMYSAVEAKQAINESRLWAEADEFGVIRHKGETRF